MVRRKDGRGRSRRDREVRHLADGAGARSHRPERGDNLDHRVILVTGLGPGDLDRVPEPVRSILLAPDNQVVLRTLHHPAAEQLAGIREVVACDDLYQASERFDDVYEAIVDRVLKAAGTGNVVYAVPGSPM